MSKTDAQQALGDSTIVGDDLVLVPAGSGASTLYVIADDRVLELGTFATPAAAWAAIDGLDRVA